MNKDMEKVFTSTIEEMRRDMTEGDYLAVPSADTRPPLAFKRGALAIIEISGDVLKHEPGARVLRLQRSDDPLVHPDLLRPGAGWAMLIDELDQKVPRDYLCALMCYARCASDSSMHIKAVLEILDEWNKNKQGFTHATATLHKGGGETRTSQNLDHDGLDTSHTPDRVFVAVYPSSVAETDRFRDFNEITNQKMRDAFMANANPAQQAFMRRMEVLGFRV